MKKYSISVTDLALPSPREGSIDTYSGFRQASQLAITVHKTVQLQKQKDHPNYQSEVVMQHEFTSDKFIFRVSGRLDGIYHSDKLTQIEEVKTAFDAKKLIDSLADNYLTHPYWLQLQMYGYIYWLKNQTLPRLNLLIVSLRDTKKVHELSLDFNIDSFELWLNRRLSELVAEIKESKNRIKRRKKLSTQLIFPFAKARPQQEELIQVVSKTIKEKRPMLLQAPTGLGKTIGILFPTLQDALLRGQKAIYLTPKNSQHQIAFDTVKLLQAQKVPFKSLQLTAKKKLCMKNEPFCSSSQCEFAKNHYSKCTDNNLFKLVKRKKNLQAIFFKKLAHQYQICPYEMQMQSIPYVDIIIADYNYVFSSNPGPSRLSALSLGESQKPNLIIDEIHNLPQRSQDYFSAQLDINYLERFNITSDKYPPLFQKKFTQAIRKCQAILMQSLKINTLDTHLVELEILPFKQQNEKLQQLLVEYLDLEIHIEEHDSVFKLCNYWSDFSAALEFVTNNKEVFFISFNPKQKILKITCCDASNFIKEHYPQFQQIIGFSATLKPFSYYSQLIGLNTQTLYTQEFQTPFKSHKRKLLIIPQVSTRYKDRQYNIPKIIQVIQRISDIKKGNYFIFFPSFDFLEQVFEKMPASSHYHYLKQRRSMSATETKNLLMQLDSPNKYHLFFAVQGGIFAEGIDYSGDLAIGAFIVGPPLPLYHWEREYLKSYYERHYQAGQEYAYIYPAMAKTIQAAGRVIRTESDKGIIILLDNRFLDNSFTQCMPADWFVQSPLELVSRAIIQEISTFWKT